METGAPGDLFAAVGIFAAENSPERRINTVAVRAHCLAGFAGSRFELVRRIVPFIA